MIADRSQAVDFLYSRLNYEQTALPADLKLDRMRDLLHRLGDPQDSLNVVHIAGTKGKGSTSAMLASILRAAGKRTGLYTSPHLERLEERFVVDGRPISSDDLTRLTAELEPIVRAMDAQAAGYDPPGPTFFEIATAIAWLYFVEQRVDAAVMEVGMGGRLDSTNVCTPDVTIITNISFDHTQQLGNRLELIAREKAGIVKPGVPVVSGATAPEAQRVIEQICDEQGARLVQLGRDMRAEYFPPRDLEAGDARPQVSVTFHRGAKEPLARMGSSLQLDMGLLGRHQADNAAIAVGAVAELNALGWEISEQHLRAGLANVRWPARIEVAGRSPTVIVDVAHNAASVVALIETLDESFRAEKRRLVFAASRDKDLRGMLRPLLAAFDEVIFTAYTANQRAFPPEELAAVARELSDRPLFVVPNAVEAWREAHRRSAPRDLVCLSGSVFLAAELRSVVLSDLGSRDVWAG